MAEVFTDNSSTSNDQEKPISVLLLATKWQFDTYGLSTVNKSLVNNLRVVDPEGKKIKINCAVVEEEKNIKDDQRDDAAKYKVQLRGGKQPRGPKEKPNITWLDRHTGTHYFELMREDRYQFIIGHAPTLANASFNLRDICPSVEDQPKVVLMIHGLPKTREVDVDADTLLDWLTEADVVFSVGKSVEAELLPHIASLPPEDRPEHKLYIPSYPLELFSVHRDIVKFKGTQNIALMTGELKDLEINGIDFPLAVSSAAGASKHIFDFEGVKTNLILLTDNKEDNEQWKQHFVEILNNTIKSRTLQFQSDSPENLEKLKIYMRKSNLMILPLKSDSLIFGSEALSAIAAGVPVLVPNHSGIASLLQTLSEDQSIIRESSSDSDVNTWKEGILEKLLRPEESQRMANRMKEQLLLDTSIAQTHLDFIRTIVEESSVLLKVEFDCNSVVAQEHIDMAVKFGIDLENLNAPVEAKKYILAFIHKLLLQREKLDRKQLTDYLQSNISTLWREVLSTLESSDRKLLSVQNGSLIFTLFCPSISSARELKNESWIKTFTLKMEQLLQKIGVEARLRIATVEDATLPTETELMSRLPEMALRHTAQSEGYETMTQHSSDIVSEIFPGRSKVMEWLEQQPDANTELETEEISTTMSLHETMQVHHIVKSAGDRSSSLYTSFVVSESGCIGIASADARPFLSVIYPGTDKPPLILSRDNRFTSPFFVKISDQEHLAAASEDQIHLWNLTKNTSSVAYKFKESGRWHLCVIDNRTVACVAEKPDSSQHFSKIYILNTDTEKFSLNSTILVRADGTITDICYVKVTDGTACLLLNYAYTCFVQLVEIIGGKVRWQIGIQQMGGSFHPWTICTDGSTVFVVNALPAKLHLLSVEDGSVVMPVSLLSFGHIYPGFACLRGDYLYVGHMDEKRETYCISKFSKPAVI